MQRKSRWEDDQLIVDDEDTVELESMDEDELYDLETSTEPTDDEEDLSYSDLQSDDEY